jgi:hypothetical protein
MDFKKLNFGSKYKGVFGSTEKCNFAAKTDRNSIFFVGKPKF